MPRDFRAIDFSLAAAGTILMDATSRISASGIEDMEFNRPQMFMAGLVVLLLGFQFRIVDSVVLNEKTTQFLAQKMESDSFASSAPMFFAAHMPMAKKVITPPRWLGWSLVSIGGVIVLHSLAMRK